MSASLVGSEMCIRDRPATPCRTLREWRRARSSLRRSATASGVSTTAEAVSYTHLTLPTICSV
eukprot:6248603-Alexandrium_andersonii.AAC.1